VPGKNTTVPISPASRSFLYYSVWKASKVLMYSREIPLPRFSAYKLLRLCASIFIAFVLEWIIMKCTAVTISNVINDGILSLEK
jgi:hypothetical protein